MIRNESDTAWKEVLEAYFKDCLDYCLPNKFIDWLIGLPMPLELEYLSKVYDLEESKKMPYISSAEKFGIKKGEEKGKMDVATHLLEDGAKPAYVKKVTGLSLIKIKQLQQTVKKKSH